MSGIHDSTAMDMRLETSTWKRYAISGFGCFKTPTCLTYQVCARPRLHARFYEQLSASYNDVLMEVSPQEKVGRNRNTYWVDVPVR